MVASHPFMSDYARPDPESDTLFESSYHHVNGSDCTGCDSSKVVQRKPRFHDQTFVHYGTIGSANTVMKDGQARDKLRVDLDVLAVEMEAAGSFENFPCLVVRGICDYSDSHKNKDWQPYAAAAAAAYTQELLSMIPPKDVADLLNLSKGARRWAASVEEGTAELRPTTKRVRPYTSTNWPEDEHDGHLSKVVRITPTPTTGDSQNERLQSSQKSYPAGFEERKPLSEAEKLELVSGSLRFPQMNFRLASIKHAVASTCHWHLTNEIYQQWLDDNQMQSHNGFLWIRGKPAAGKSTIMKFAMTEYQKCRPDCTIISFFFNARGSELEKSVHGMYRSLLAQLLEVDSKLLHVFDKYAMFNTTRMEELYWEVPIMRVILIEMLKKLSSSRLTIFVDALDESDEDDIREVVSHFEEIAELAVDGNILQVCICLSSRHYPHISLSKGLEMVLEEESGHRRDITAYLKQKLREGSRQKSEKLRDQILHRSSGVFLWVVLVVDILNKVFDHGQIHAMERRLDDIPNDLHTLFAKILTRDSRGIRQLQICLRWVLYSSRPLTCSELYHAINFELGSVEDATWDHSSVSVQDMHRYILDCSKGLVELELTKSADEEQSPLRATAGVEDHGDELDSITSSLEPTSKFTERSRVHFIHESVKDFLIGTDGLEEIFPHLRRVYESTIKGIFHEQLKQCCQKYLSMISEDREWAAYPLWNYSAECVFYHADAAQQQGISQTRFLQEFPCDAWERIVMESLFDLFTYTVGNRPLLSIFAVLGLESLSKLVLENESNFGHTWHRADRRNIHHVDTNGMNALSVAAYFGRTSLVRSLLTGHDFDVRAKCFFGRTALWWAVYKDRADIVKLFLEHEAQTEDASGNKTDDDSLLRLADNNGLTPFLAAVHRGSDVMVSILTSYGADNLDIDRYGNTPLSLAAMNGRIEILKQILLTNNVALSDSAGTGLLWKVIMRTKTYTEMRAHFDRERELLVFELEKRERLKYAKPRRGDYSRKPYNLGPVLQKDGASVPGISIFDAHRVIELLTTSGLFKLIDEVRDGETLLSRARHLDASNPGSTLYKAYQARVDSTGDDAPECLARLLSDFGAKLLPDNHYEE